MATGDPPDFFPHLNDLVQLLGFDYIQPDLAVLRSLFLLPGWSYSLRCVIIIMDAA
jgi:hypothetical protein